MSEDLFDQASGLRRWAEQHQVPDAMAQPHVPAPVTTDRTLLIFGPQRLAAPARQTLSRWHRQGQAWVGHPDRWHVHTVDRLSAEHHGQVRWGIWVGADLDAFRTAFASLRQLRDQGGPDCVLALHAGFVGTDGLLDNLRDAARRYLGVRLLIIDEWRR